MEKENSPELKRGLGLMDSSMLIMGSMIGSGIFIVSADIARQVGSPLMLLLNWGVAALITILGALSYGELAAAMPKAGGQYVYLKTAYNKLVAFVYGWTLFTVIQTGTIAAVGIAFAKFMGVFSTAVSDKNILLDLHFIQISSQQIIGILVIWLLTLSNFRAVKSGARLQNFLTVIKITSLLGMIVLGFWFGFSGKGSWGNFSGGINTGITLTIGLFGAALVGSLFSADAWNNITFTAGEVNNPQRNLPLSLIIGTGTVMLIYMLANVAYIYLLPFDKIQTAPQDRVATLLMQEVLGNAGMYVMAVMIMISTFGCLNGIILSGARVYFAMANDGLFFPQASKLNKNNVPSNALIFQAIWASGLALSGSYEQLLDYVMFAVLLFYVFTVAGIFILRIKQPDMERPYKAFGYPIIPAIYILLAGGFCIDLLIYKPDFTLPGLGIVLAGIPVYFLVRGMGKKSLT
ncbi:MAG: amino acid permease [Bacteroidetes bacterium]|nr:amino acid permease [Bacteroidota bacterium]